MSFSINISFLPFPISLFAPFPFCHKAYMSPLPKQSAYAPYSPTLLHVKVTLVLELSGGSRNVILRSSREMVSSIFEMISLSLEQYLLLAGLEMLSSLGRQYIKVTHNCITNGITLSRAESWENQCLGCFSQVANGDLRYTGIPRKKLCHPNLREYTP